jgi:hypothetical protein
MRVTIYALAFALIFPACATQSVVECDHGESDESTTTATETETSTTTLDTGSGSAVCVMPLSFSNFSSCFDPTCCTEMTVEEADNFCISKVSKNLDTAVACTKHPDPSTQTDGRICQETENVLHCNLDGIPYVIECCEPPAK